MIGNRKRAATHCGYFNTNTQNKCPKTLDIDLPGTKMNSEPPYLPTNQLAPEQRLSDIPGNSLANLNYSGSKSAFSIFTKKPKKPNPTLVENDFSNHELNELTFTG